MADVTGEITSLEAERFRLMLAKDAAALETLMDDQLVYTHSFGDRDTKASYMQKFRQGFFDYHEISHRIDCIVARGDAVIITGLMSAKATVGGQQRQLENVYTAVWGRESAKDWRLVAFQPTPLPQI